MMPKKIDFIGLGFCSNDYLCILPYIPIDSKVQMLSYEVQGGGPAGTATVAAARLGMSTAFVGAIGDDDAGKRILSDFNSEDVDTHFLKVRENSCSPIAYCWIEQKTGNRSVAWTRGAIRELQAGDIDEELIRNAKILHLDGHNPVGALQACKIAKANHVLINLDAGTMRDGIKPLIEYADILISSEEFACAYSGESDLEKALIKMKEIGALVTGVTMGSKGSMIYDNGEFIRCPAFPVKNVVDTTGCGDVFHTGFGVRYLETKDLLDCQRFGAAVSALKCGKIGGRAGIPTRIAVEEFLRKN